MVIKVFARRFRARLKVRKAVSKVRNIGDLKGAVPKPAKPVSVEEMNKAVRRHAER
jgi:hypothetical protein